MSGSEEDKKKLVEDAEATQKSPKKDGTRYGIRPLLPMATTAESFTPFAGTLPQAVPVLLQIETVLLRIAAVSL